MSGQPTWSDHDLCITALFELNCDGTVADDEDPYTLGDALTGAETSVTLDTPISDETPDFGAMILDADGSANGPETVYYESVDRDTGVFTLSSSKSSAVVSAHALASDVTIRRSEPLVHCAALVSRIVPQTIAEQIDTLPSGQTGQNIARRRVAPQPDGGILEIDLAGRHDPELYSLCDTYAPIIDPDFPDVYIGFEEVVATSSNCPTCGGESATCAHGVAAVLIYNAWCGDERHPDYPYVALVGRSLDFEPSTETQTNQRGFTPGITIRGTLKQNSAFVAPFGIDPRPAGVLARWSKVLISQARIDADADLEGFLLNGCGCAACTAPALTYA